jgi:hypothetical protein
MISTAEREFKTERQKKNDRVATRTGTLGAGTRSERRATTSEDDAQWIKRASIFQVAKP